MTKKLGTVRNEEQSSAAGSTISMVQRFERNQQQVNRSVSFVDNRVKQLESELHTERNLLAEREAEIHELQRQVNSKQIPKINLSTF